MRDHCSTIAWAGGNILRRSRHQQVSTSERHEVYVTQNPETWRDIHVWHVFGRSMLRDYSLSDLTISEVVACMRGMSSCTSRGSINKAQRVRRIAIGVIIRSLWRRWYFAVVRDSSGSASFHAVRNLCVRSYTCAIFRFQQNLCSCAKPSKAHRGHGRQFLGRSHCDGLLGGGLKRGICSYNQ